MATVLPPLAGAVESAARERVCAAGVSHMSLRTAPRSLLDVPTWERTEQELERERERYEQSKTVAGRLCPTPELRMAQDDLGLGDGRADAPRAGGEIGPERGALRGKKGGGGAPRGVVTSR